MNRRHTRTHNLILIGLALLITGGCAQRSPDLIPASTLLAEAVPTESSSGASVLSAPSVPTAKAAPPTTPTPRPTRQPPEQLSRTYTVQSGDTLSAIATVLDVSIEELMQVNGLTDAHQLSIGQVLQIPMKVTTVGPPDVLIPDSELVYGPGYSNFDVAAETSQLPGWFNSYSELMANGETLTAAEIVTLVSQEYSVGPRVLLTLLEMEGGWLTNPDPTPQARLYPLGYERDGWDGLAAQLMWAADNLNEGFYGWLHETLWTVRLNDGSYIQFHPGLNSGTAALQQLLAQGADYETLAVRLQAFDATYRQLWGNPFAYAVEPLLPPETQAPTLSLPWAEGETWYYTGGPHGGWGDGSAWAALDFATREQNLGCYPSSLWVRAAAPGAIVMSRDGMVLQDLDGYQRLTTGWVLLYMHMAAEGRVGAGATVETGDPIGHPSCEGGFSNASHLHFARRYNGVWIAAEHPSWPLVLGGWAAGNGERPYDGTLSRGDVVKTAQEDWIPDNAVER